MPSPQFSMRLRGPRPAYPDHDLSCMGTRPAPAVVADQENASPIVTGGMQHQQIRSRRPRSTRRQCRSSFARRISPTTSRRPSPPVGSECARGFPGHRPPDAAAHHRDQRARVSRRSRGTHQVAQRPQGSGLAPLQVDLHARALLARVLFPVDAAAARRRAAVARTLSRSSHRSSRIWQSRSVSMVSPA